MNNSDPKESETFNDFLRRVFKRWIDPVVGVLDKLGFHANTITAAGFLGNLIAGLLVAKGHLFWGAITLIVLAPLDALDGALARLRNECSAYGSFVDSFVDRYSEIVLYGGLLFYFMGMDDWQGATLIFFAAAGSIMVSYARAKAESVHFEAKKGLLARVERYLVLIPGLLLGYPRISLWILAVLSNFTALQRFWQVRSQAIQKKKQEKMGQKEEDDG